MADRGGLLAFSDKNVNPSQLPLIKLKCSYNAIMLQRYLVKLVFTTKHFKFENTNIFIKARYSELLL